MRRVLQHLAKEQMQHQMEMKQLGDEAGTSPAAASPIDASDGLDAGRLVGAVGGGSIHGGSIGGSNDA